MTGLTKLLGGAALSLVLAAGLAAPAFAQKLDGKNGAGITQAATTSNADIDFGDDSSDWSKDGECDDPRFTGTGSADETIDEDILKDATDCKAAYDAGTVILVEETAATTTATTTTLAEPDFGDDSSEWAKDGECDDPRFEGADMADEVVDADILKDATDCRAAYTIGTVTLKGGTSPTDIAIATPIDAIDFGDDTGEWANDGECDDPRFTGTGSAAETLDADIRKDATDCKAAYEAGTVTLAAADDTSATATTTTTDIAYGDDTSEWNNDGECDDPRFQGTGVATELLDADKGHDATDCRAAVEAGTATFNGGDVATVATGDIDYGDDTSEWANDGECDDPRFSGTGVASEPVNADTGRDATDCQAAVEAGTATFGGGSATAEFDYGSDWSKWALDGECDDLRFTGEGTDKKLLTEDIMGDATDCKTLEAEGKVTIRTVYTPEYAAGAPYDSKGIDFGNNSSDYANDDQCDDPRFEGPGAATTLLDSDLLHDSADCKAAYEAGTIVRREGV